MRKTIGLWLLGILFAGMVGCSPSTDGATAGTPQLFAPQVKKASAPIYSTAVDSEEGINHVVLGYYTGEQASYEAFSAFSAYLNMVSVDVFTVQMDGSITGSDVLSIHSLTDSHAIQIFACVSNYNNDPSVNDFDPELAHAAIDTNRAKTIENLVDLAVQGDYAGVNIDFENLAYSANIESDRAAFTEFIEELAGALHAHGLSLLVSVPAKTEESVWNTWAYPFDLAALGNAADLIQLMTYDQHGPWSEPGAVAGADWVEESLRFAVSQIDPAKLLIGLPAYGYDWDLTASDVSEGTYSVVDIDWLDFSAMLEKPHVGTGWDSTALSPFLTYTENGHTHVVWYENTDSIRAKVDLMQVYDLAGLSMWALGKEDESFWQAVQEGSN